MKASKKNKCRGCGNPCEKEYCDTCESWLAMKLDIIKEQETKGGNNNE